MRIQNNIMAMNTHRMYTTNNNNVAKSAEKLSSGYRINRAGDDAAGLAISEKMRAQIRGLNMASKNSQDAVSLVQTAEGALQEVHSMLQRMNELAVQAASDTNDSGVDRAALQQEFSNLQDEIDQIASTTKFNNMALLDGKVDANGDPVAASVALAQVAQTGTPTATSEGKVTFAITDAGAIQAKVDGTDTAGATVTATGVVNDWGDDTATVAGAGNVTVTFDSVTTTLTVGADATVGDVKAAINSLTYTVEGTSTTAASTAAGDATAAATLGSLASTTITYAPAAANGTTDTGAITFAVNAADPTKLDLLVGGEVKASATVTAMTVAGGTVANQVLDFDAYGTVTIASTDTTDGNTASAAELITAASALTDTFTAGATTTTYAVKNNSVAIDGGNGNPASWVIQVGAEEGQTMDIKISAMNTTGLAITKANNTANEAAINNTAGGAVSIHNRASAAHAITRTRTAINTVSTQRAELGAMQNRLEHKIANLDNTAENLSSAESRIRDVDIAKEMTNFTKNNILAQASTAMLAQANAAPQGVLSLLQ